MAEPALVLQRSVDDGTCCLGKLTLPSGLVLSSIERPWLDNAPRISCIPPGTYKMAFTRSPRFGIYLYELRDVPGREGIRFHVANWAAELHGCVALGIAHGPRMVLQSRIAINKFHEEMKGRPATVTILAPPN